MIKAIIMSFVLIGILGNASLAQETDHQIHNELRSVLHTVESAINSGEYDKMLPVLSEQIRATPINQEFLASKNEVMAYFTKWFGAKGYLKKLEMQLTPDALTELSADKTWGLVRGKGIEKYILQDGRPYDLHTRWTALLVKEEDSHWRLRSIHIATNFLDNAILSEAEHALGKATGGGLVGGLCIGVLSGWWIGRRKKKS